MKAVAWSSQDETSQCLNEMVDCGYSAETEAAIAGPVVLLMSRIATRWPWEAKWWVRARPIPLVPPVMRIDLGVWEGREAILVVSVGRNGWPGGVLDFWCL